MATNGFKIFNENNSNIMPQVEYETNPVRTGGIVAGKAAQDLYNKVFRQSSIMTAALGEVLKNAGVSVDDTNLTNLVNALTSILSASNKLLSPAANLAAMKAIDTTLTTDTSLIDCKTLGLFRFDSSSSDTADDVNIIQPTTGPGRWVKITGTTYADFASIAMGPYTMNFGSNSLTSTSKVPASADIQITGKHYVNTLGAYGNCESVTPFTAVSGCTLSLDTSKKVFGANALKITLTGSTGIVTIPIGSTYNVAGYALLSAYLDKGTATNIKLEKDATGGGVSKSVTSTDVTPTRQGVLIQPSDNNAGNLIKLTVTGTTGQVAYVDGILPTEISSAEYAMSVATIMGLYPYADSLAVVTNPMVEITHADGSKTKTVIEGRFYTGENPKLVNGKVIGQKLWHEAVLFGKDYDWQYSSDQSGFKTISLNGAFPNAEKPQFPHLVKYDGKPIPFTNGVVTSGDMGTFNASANIYVTISDTDAGWTETLSPNADEVKAFMNSWKAINSSGTRYCGWAKMGAYEDGTCATDILAFPTGTATTLTVATTGVNTITVADISPFKIGDWIAVWGLGGTTITGIAGNVLTLAANQGAGIPIGRTVIRLDNGTTDIRILNYCKSNLAPNYTGYKLAYKLATAEPSTAGLEMSKVDARLKGDSPILENGVNTIVVDTGIVLDEVSTPSVSGGYAFINYDPAPYNNTLFIPCRTKWKNQAIYKIYKDGADDTAKWTIDSTDGYGIQRAYIAQANYDPSAIYTVDYKRLATEAPQIGTVALSYNTGLTDAIADLQNQVNAKQTKDPALDAIVDASMYEVLNCTGADLIVPFLKYGVNTTYIQIIIPMKSKKTKSPSVSVSCTILGNSLDLTNLFKLYAINVLDNAIAIEFVSTDAGIYSGNYNAFLRNVRVTVDCRKGV